MFYVKSGFPTQSKPTIVRLTLSNMFASCTVCGKEVHLSPEEVTHNIIRLMDDSYLCPLCRNELICELCDDDLEEDDDFEDEDDFEDNEDEFDDDEDDDGDEACDDEDDDPEYEDDAASSGNSPSHQMTGLDYGTAMDDFARMAAAEAEHRFENVTHGAYEKARREIMNELKTMIYGNPAPRVENIVTLQEAGKGKI